MIRIHFTAADLGRVMFAAAPEPLWEAALAARALRSRGLGNRSRSLGELPTTPLARRWRRAAAPRLKGSMRPLFKLIAPGGQFPDFLTPPVAGLEPAVEALTDTPAEVIRDELGPWLPAELEPFLRGLLAGAPASRRALGVAVLDFHQQVLTPSSAELERRYAADLALRSHALLHGGVDVLLTNLHPDVEWSTPVLSTYGVTPGRTLDIHLNGRGLRLYPSPLVADCLAFDTPAHRPILIYPCTDHPAEDPSAADALADLLGRTRALVLRSLFTPASTTQLARRLGISLPSTSDHTRILRSAGLLTTHRTNGTALHSLTPTAHRLLSGATRGRLSSGGVRENG